MMKTVSRTSRVGIALAALAFMTISVAEARMGRGGGFGSRGARTYTAPPPTATAPRQAQPVERSMTQPGQAGVQRPATAAPVGAPSRGLGFGAGIFAGLLGAGVLGMLMGNGFFGGLAGLGSFFGLLLQLGLIVGLVWLALRFFRSRQQPAVAGAGNAPSYGRSPLAGLGLGGGGTAPAAAQKPVSKSGVPGDEIGVGEADYKSFERLLGDIQTAYGREDLTALRGMTTPEMVSFLAEELTDNAKNGVVNVVTEPKLLQGDLAEAWREGDADYATVAMRYSIVDVTRERATDRVVAGDPAASEEVTDLWTFARRGGGNWKLSAIQQA